MLISPLLTGAALGGTDGFLATDGCTSFTRIRLLVVANFFVIVIGDPVSALHFLMQNWALIQDEGYRVGKSQL